MGIRKSYGKNKKTGRHKMLAGVQHDALARKALKRPARRGRRAR